jgi:uncharacterized membrane protein YbaN (DUF454 family)
MMRVLWSLLGLLATACGIAGLLLPLVPTTPFLLIAAFAFARSSPRLHGWLVTHPRLGPPIAAWREHRAIRRGAKMTAVLLMAAAASASVALGVPGWVLAVQAVVLAIVATFVLTRPEPPADWR